MSVILFVSGSYMLVGCFMGFNFHPSLLPLTITPFLPSPLPQSSLFSLCSFTPLTHHSPHFPSLIPVTHRSSGNLNLSAPGVRLSAVDSAMLILAPSSLLPGAPPSHSLTPLAHPIHLLHLLEPPKNPQKTKTK